MELNRESAVPIAHQLLELIRGQIARGELEPGTRLPTELELCERLGVSRTPVRQALGRLTAEGLLVRHPGRGTFVNASVTIERRAVPRELSITVPEERWCWPLQQAAALWTAEHPEQPVRLSFRIVGLVQLRSKLALAVAQGEASDISLVDSAWVAEFAERGYIRSLDGIDQQAAAAMAADLFPALRRVNSFHNELYALQAEADLALLWYRRDWFAAEGLAPPRTWDEWLRCALHFRRAAARDRYGLGPYPLAFAGGAAAGETATYQLLPVLWSAGADVIVDDEVVLASPAARRAVAFVAELVRKHRVASIETVGTTWNGPALALAAGTVAMALGGSYERALIRSAAGWDEAECRDRLGFVPIPAGPGGAPTTLVGGMSYAIYRQSRQPHLALALLSLATSPAVLRGFCSRTGQNPPTVPAARAFEAEAEPFLHATARLLPEARARWPLVEYARVSAQLVGMFERAILDELPPEEAVVRAAAVISGITGLSEREEARPHRLAPRRPGSSRREHAAAAPSVGYGPGQHRLERRLTEGR